MAAALIFSSPGIHLTHAKPKNSRPCFRSSLHFRRLYFRSSGLSRRAQSDGSFRRGYETVDESYFDGYDVVAEGEESDDGVDETESSVDLLIKFLQSIYRKVSKQAKKASRTVLPSAMSPQLVSFAVDGILLLASLSLAKAFLEVICTLGGAVFAVILLMRVVWAVVAYFQTGRTDFNQGGSSFGASQPIA